ncbi:hypothetical protein ACFQY7_04540 [Actinomadura luteofluorescens]|uniref:Uncharacterized protein n=1 Tax=Actinomadura luteofluorescens TaxID=46163 RepID=A0A7Y9JDG0_9ACTN|nr:hypothetical protein [Actinomadura luteofluorescens]NYD44860.1 hypothetical protein [Actinomadura luteofluorescens]
MPDDDLSTDAVAERRPCKHCGRPIPRGVCRDAEYCSPAHRTARHKARSKAETAGLARTRTLRGETAQLGRILAAFEKRTGVLTDLLNGAVTEERPRTLSRRAARRRPRGALPTRPRPAPTRPTPRRRRRTEQDVKVAAARRDAREQVAAARADAERA